MSRVFVSGRILEEGCIIEGAGRRLSFSIPRGRKAREGEKRRKLPGAGRTKIKKDGPEKGAATSRPPLRWGRDSCEQSFRFWRDFRGRMYYRRYGAEFVFFIRLLEKGWVAEGAERGVLS